MLLYKLLTVLINLVVYIGVFSVIITVFCSAFGVKNPLGKMAKTVGNILAPLGKWLLELLKDLLKILLRLGLRLIELFFEFLGRIFSGLADILREKRY